MNKLFEKISWKTRKWRNGFDLFTLYLHDSQETWGFDLFTIHSSLRSYSLLSFQFRLPNKTSVRVFTVDHWDLLFLHRPLWKEYDDLTDRKMWGSKLSWWENVKISLLSLIF